jgi:CRISPR/Cas system-associated exonuclease Cas4 (RecB family)
MKDFDQYLSYTGFKKYVSCPQSYYLEYIEKKRPPMEDQRNTLNGNSLHQLLEDYIKIGDGDVDWLLNNSDRVWDETLASSYVLWKHDDDSQAVLEKMRMFTTNLAALLKDSAINTAVMDGSASPELKADTVVNINGTRLKMAGRVDLLIKNSYNDYIFYDLKASENRSIMEFDQLVWYSIVLGAYLKDMEQPTMGGYILPGFSEIKTYKIPAQAREKLLSRLDEVLRRIREGIWTPMPEDKVCFWCPVKYCCPVKGKLIPHGSGVIQLG